MVPGAGQLDLTRIETVVPRRRAGRPTIHEPAGRLHDQQGMGGFASFVVEATVTETEDARPSIYDESEFGVLELIDAIDVADVVRTPVDTVGGRVDQVGHTPHSKCCKRVPEPESPLGHGIPHSIADRPNLAFDQAGGLELAQAIREHASADAWEATRQLRVTTGTLHQLLKDDQSPAVTDNI
jgi:hypothetical protein